jgi:hypothetical protein
MTRALFFNIQETERQNPMTPLPLNLLQYMSPATEVSFYKNIPIKHLEEVQAIFRKNIKGLRYVFRGPRYDALRVSTRKKDAFAFSVYKRG